MPYDGDSFLTLSAGGQAGLVVLSLLLCGLMITLVRRVAGLIGRGRAVLVAVALYWLYVWLSPQVYYAYYLLIFDGLPVQVVTGAPPGPLQCLLLLTFTGPATLSAHSLGALGWGMIAGALWRKPRAAPV